MKVRRGRQGQQPLQTVVVTLARAFSHNLMDVCAVKYNQCKIDKRVWNTQKAHFLERKELLLLFFSVGSISCNETCFKWSLIDWIDVALPILTPFPSQSLAFEHTIREQFPRFQALRTRNWMTVLALLQV